jgi:hypothetical protein
LERLSKDQTAPDVAVAASTNAPYMGNAERLTIPWKSSNA